ncbi:GNAT family N-acetyltransferase [Pseudarthrobacter sp. J1738]|uniref:GNAT family N-acetyltransferase n=1 Tax=unclassified Pseudarthrobacter TaxID=2647000 RepID=UPI003D2C22D5
MTYTIRPATTSDAEALAELAAVTFPLACPPTSSPADISAHIARTLSVGSFAEYLADAGVTITVLENEVGLRAYSLMVNRPTTDPDVAAALTLLPSVELSKFYVHPDFHGQGAAARLMQASLDTAGKLAGNPAGIWLNVNQNNPRALRFYGKSGFTQVGVKTFHLGDSVENDFVMERPLQ